MHFDAHFVYKYAALRIAHLRYSFPWNIWSNAHTHTVVLTTIKPVSRFSNSSTKLKDEKETSTSSSNFVNIIYVCVVEPIVKRFSLTSAKPKHARIERKINTTNVEWHKRIARKITFSIFGEEEVKNNQEKRRVEKWREIQKHERKKRASATKHHRKMRMKEKIDFKISFHCVYASLHIHTLGKLRCQ